MMMAFLLPPTSTSAALVMYRSLRSPFSSELVASKSNRACKGSAASANAPISSQWMNVQTSSQSHMIKPERRQHSLRKSALAITWATVCSKSSGSAPLSFAIFFRAGIILARKGDVNTTCKN